MNGSSFEAERPVISPEEIENGSLSGATTVTIMSIRAIEITAPVSWTMTRVPDAIPRRQGGTAAIMALILGELNVPEPTPTIVSHSADCQEGESTCRVVVPTSPAAEINMPRTKGRWDPWRSAHAAAGG